MLADALVGRTGRKRAPFALGVAALFGFPIFFEAGLVIFLPILFTVARRVGGSLLFYAAGGGCLRGHARLRPAPPRPGGGVGLIDADIGLVLVFGILIGVPTWFRLLPLVLIFGETGLNTLVEAGVVDGENTVVQVIRMIGQTPVALLIAVLVAIVVCGIAQGRSAKEVEQITDSSFGPIASIILITGAGGMFGAVLRRQCDRPGARRHSGGHRTVMETLLGSIGFLIAFAISAFV